MSSHGLPHFLLIPYSELGHINPMLSLASQLVSLGCTVTFVKAEKQAAASITSSAARCTQSESEALRAVPSTEYEALSATSEVLNSAPTANADAAPERLRFVTLPARNNAPSGVDPKTVSRHQIFKNTLAGLEQRQDLVASIVEESMASSFPITCIICDLFLWKWVRRVARAYCLRSAVLCILSALTFYTYYLDSMGKEEEIEEILVSQFGMPSKKDAMAYYGLSNLKDSLEGRLQKHKVFVSLFEGLEDANPILVNSFETLEAPLLPSLHASLFDVRFIGPCLPKWHKDDLSLGSSMAQQAGSIFMEDEACLTWLDRQEKGSVLFVSFGSEGEVNAKQIEEIKMGIKESGHKFLWVVRSNALASEQINDQEKGMFVSWAPQIKVLQHLAVGGFLTHSGWNSTLESVTFGVPMLCLPILGDQSQNANFVHKYLQVGLRLSASIDGLVHREEVASGVKAIMQGRFSQRVTQFRELAQLAIQEAHHNLSSFVQDMN